MSTINSLTLSGNSTLSGVTYNTNNQSIPRQITISPVANGYTINIGCQTFVFESLANLLYRIEEYYNDPAKIEGHFNERKELPIILPKKK